MPDDEMTATKARARRAGQHRAVEWLELFYDLVVVAAVAVLRGSRSTPPSPVPQA
jgi:low temperature requirement protein LtrA